MHINRIVHLKVVSGSVQLGINLTAQLRRQVEKDIQLRITDQNYEGDH